MKNRNFNGVQLKPGASVRFLQTLVRYNEIKLREKNRQFEICLKQWQHRKLTLMGKVTVVKNFAPHKLIFALSSLPNPPKSTIDRIEKIMYSFIWDGKPDKIKRNTLIQNYEKRGIKMINIEKMYYVFKGHIDKENIR